MTRLLCFWAVIAALIAGVSCDIPNDKRCSPGQKYADGLCELVPTDNDEDKGTDTGDLGTDTGDLGTDTGDLGTDTGDLGTDANLPTGLGTKCEVQADCAGFEADYCAFDPFSKRGICTVANCKPDPDSCPTGWKCCDFPKTIPVPDICMLPSDWNEQKANGLCL